MSEEKVIDLEIDGANGLVIHWAKGELQEEEQQTRIRLFPAREYRLLVYMKELEE